MKCCKLLVDGELEALPFERAIIIDWYDGPTHGFTECSHCGQTFSFRMADWDDQQGIRVFGFAPIDVPVHEIVSRLNLQWSGNDKKSVIVPPLLESASRLVDALFGKTPTHVTAFEGWPGSSSVWKTVEELKLKGLNDWEWDFWEESAKRDWFALLGLNRKKLTDRG